jgi:nucleotide-binding universal stress UspA family protein
MKLKNLLVATDFSPVADRAFEAGLALAAATKGKLTLLHVAMPIVLVYKAIPASISVDIRDRDIRAREAVQRKLDTLVARARRRRVRISTILSLGEPVAGVLSSIRKIRPDVVILGTHGRGGASHLLLGSVAEKVVRTAPCSVLIVKNRKWSTKGRVVLALDDSPMAVKVARAGASVARQLRAPLTVIHALRDPGWILEAAGSSRSDKILREVIALGQKKAQEKVAALLSKAHVTVRARDVIIGEGRPQDVIVRAAGARTMLTIVGTEGRRGFSRVITGSVAEAVVRRAPSPVLVMKKLR